MYLSMTNQNSESTNTCKRVHALKFCTLLTDMHNSPTTPKKITEILYGGQIATEIKRDIMEISSGRATKRIRKSTSTKISVLTRMEWSITIETLQVQGTDTPSCM